MKNIQIYTQILKNDLLSRIDHKDSWDKTDLKSDILTIPTKQNLKVIIPDIQLSPLKDAEREKIIQVLKTTEWNISSAARTLVIDRKTLRNKIKRYELVHDAGFEDNKLRLTMM